MLATSEWKSLRAKTLVTTLFSPVINYNVPDFWRFDECGFLCKEYVWHKLVSTNVLVQIFVKLS